MSIVYILFSKKLQRFYVGYTSMTMKERMRRHLTHKKGFTARANDWKIVFTKEVNSKTQALKLEKKIKKRGAKRYLEDLKYK